jgi:para-aminobenzoate synthetase/4-amino-4-deoxychorismate lyase
LIEKDEILLQNQDKWLHFAKPHRILGTTNIHEVRNTLGEIEELVNANHWHAAGFVSYEASPAFDNALHVLDSGDFPFIWFGLYPQPQIVELQSPEKGHNNPNWKTTLVQESYNTAIEKIKDYIARGRTYQVNYSMRLNSKFEGNEWDFFLNLAQNRQRYAAYINTGRYVICSASPELFFQLDGETIISRPMKGTARRGRTLIEDKAQAAWLQNSPKNQAENVMIVDMIRNDIGRIAEIGTVTVPELFTIEKYPTLFQMTSTVQAKTNASLTDIFSALFPCGSITGAPKVSTMNIISELETTSRRIYTGSIGYISPNRKAQFNVAIRTALIDKETKSMEYGVGGGIVWDSTSTDEYEEALLKAQVLAEPPQEFSLLETILWTPQEGYFLLEKHIARMSDSAEYFDFTFSKERTAAYLHKLAREFKSPKRVKVLSNRYGHLSEEARDFQIQQQSFKISLAAEPIDSNNIFLFHKTTQREAYDKALVVPQIYNDVLLYNEKDELTEFTIGNLVVELNGSLVTPPVSCGLLAGTFREYLLETDQIKEQVIRKDELENGKKVFLINSLRKWVEVNI